MTATGVVQGRPVGPVDEAGVFAEVARRITDAINEGSRLFNGGRSRECAGVYFDIAQWCQGIPVLPQDCKMVLQQAARRAEAQFRESGSAEQPAWVMRNALDYTLNVVGRPRAAPEAMPAPAAQNPFLSQGMGGDVRLASSSGGMPSGPCNAVVAPVPAPCQPQAYSNYMNDGIGYGAKGASYPGAAYPAGYGGGYCRPAEVQKASYPSSYRASAYESRPARVEYIQPARRGYDDSWGGDVEHVELPTTKEYAVKQHSTEGVDKHRLPMDGNGCYVQLHVSRSRWQGFHLWCPAKDMSVKYCGCSTGQQSWSERFNPDAPGEKDAALQIIYHRLNSEHEKHMPIM